MELSIPTLELCTYDPYNCIDLDPVGDAMDKARYGPNGKFRDDLKRCLGLLDRLQGPSR